MTSGKKAQRARLSFRKVKKVQVLASDEDEDSIQRVSGSVSGFESSDKSVKTSSVKLIRQEAARAANSTPDQLSGFVKDNLLLMQSCARLLSLLEHQDHSEYHKEQRCAERLGALKGDLKDVQLQKKFLEK